MHESWKKLRESKIRGIEEKGPKYGIISKKS